VDINDLKKINDLYGHEAGDEYIKGCARIICDMVPYSPVYRIGGDEFVAIMQGTDYVQYEQRAEQIRERFERAFTNKTVSPWLRFSAAVGVAVNTDEDVSFDAVFKRADEVMYRLKREFKEHNGSYR